MWGIVRAIEWLTRLFGLIGAWLAALLILAMVYEVLSRYLLGAPTFWAYEVGYMLMGASFMFGIAHALQLRRHIRVDFLYDNLSPKQQAAIDLAGFVLLLLPVVCWTTWGLGGYFHDAYRLGEVSGESAWNPVVWPFRLTFVAGFAIFALQILAEIIKCGYVLTGRDLPDPGRHGPALPEHVA